MASRGDIAPHRRPGIVSIEGGRSRQRVRMVMVMTPLGNHYGGDDDVVLRVKWVVWHRMSRVKGCSPSQRVLVIAATHRGAT